MESESRTNTSIRTRAIGALRDALARASPAAEVDGKGYVPSFKDNLVPGVSVEDFEADLRSGDGNELETKFRAAHSSSALAVNTFAPFRRRTSYLRLLGMRGFGALRFEAKCPTGLRGGRAPNLDVLLTGAAGLIGVESKLTEYLAPHRAEFSLAYRDQIQSERRAQGWYREMLRLMDEPQSYRWLDAAQLIKHSFGLARLGGGAPVTLLYLFWEPMNPAPGSIFAEHRREVSEFAHRVEGSTPRFHAMSYPSLWAAWDDGAPDWLSAHLEHLHARYGLWL